MLNSVTRALQSVTAQITPSPLVGQINSIADKVWAYRTGLPASTEALPNQPQLLSKGWSSQAHTIQSPIFSSNATASSTTQSGSYSTTDNATASYQTYDSYISSNQTKSTTYDPVSETGWSSGHESTQSDWDKVTGSDRTPYSSDGGYSWFDTGDSSSNSTSSKSPSFVEDEGNFLTNLNLGAALEYVDVDTRWRMAHWSLAQLLLGLTLAQRRGPFIERGPAAESQGSGRIAYELMAEWDLIGLTQALIVTGAATALVRTGGNLRTMTAQAASQIGVTTLLLIADNRAIQRVGFSNKHEDLQGKGITLLALSWVLGRVAMTHTSLRSWIKAW